MNIIDKLTMQEDKLIEYPSCELIFAPDFGCERFSF